jgi:hypothetical protein
MPDEGASVSMDDALTACVRQSNLSSSTKDQETLDGELVSQKTTPQLVSKCCIRDGNVGQLGKANRLMLSPSSSVYDMWNSCEMRVSTNKTFHSCETHQISLYAFYHRSTVEIGNGDIKSYPS